MPAQVLIAFATALPRLKAQERLDDVMNVALGTGSLKKHAARGMLRRLEREATKGDKPAVVKPKNRAEHEAMLRSMNIRIAGS